MMNTLLNNMSKKITATLAIVIAAGTLGTASLAMANDHKGGQRGPSVEKLTEKLALTSEQQVQVAAIIETHKAEQAETREAKKAQREEFRTAISEVLTEEQLDEFETMKQGKKDRKGGHDNDEG